MINGPLQLDNLVLYEDEVKSIKTIFNRHSVGVKGVKNSVPMFDLQAIPLTEEWLIRFGFRWCPPATGHTGFGVIDINMHPLSVIPKDGRVHHSGILLTHVYSVHQLQNLYSALTGEELTPS